MAGHFLISVLMLLALAPLSTVIAQTVAMREFEFSAANCTGPPEVNGPVEIANVIDFCYFSTESPSEGIAGRSAKTVYNETSGDISVLSYESIDCSGEAIIVVTGGGQANLCINNEGEGSRRVDIVSLAAGSFTGLVTWDPNNFEGASAATCFPEIRLYPANQSEFSSSGVSSFHALLTSCISLGATSISIEQSSSALADAFIYATDDCTGAKSPFTGCEQVFGFSLFLGDVGQLPVTSAPTSAPTLIPTLAPSNVGDTSSPTTSPSQLPTATVTSEPTSSGVMLSFSKVIALFLIVSQLLI